MVAWTFALGVWTRALLSHYRFVVNLRFHELAYAGLVGRALKVTATLFGACLVTPIYKCVSNPEYDKTNVLYDVISPFLRRYQRLSHCCLSPRRLLTHVVMAKHAGGLFGYAGLITSMLWCM